MRRALLALSGLAIAGAAVAAPMTVSAPEPAGDSAVIAAPRDPADNIRPARDASRSSVERNRDPVEMTRPDRDASGSPVERNRDPIQVTTDADLESILTEQPRRTVVVGAPPSTKP